MDMIVDPCGLKCNIEVSPSLDFVDSGFWIFLFMFNEFNRVDLLPQVCLFCLLLIHSPLALTASLI